MPTYAYRCADCGHAFDVHQSFTDDSLTVCPECGGQLRKQYGSVGVTFKGSGFYRTDSRAGSGKGSASTTSASSTSSGKGSGSSSTSSSSSPGTSSGSGSSSSGSSTSSSSSKAASS
ncbi:putative regulatory protein, FmdB family [Krasilnikoviella flava]|uniref:Putative regulatory protein, FmdB family n=1 Tax=Krasilnikoviella flava TaxID=526729 RepID=A0A1T5IGZ4_9MICO|nr:putative regulatory protein, FmdB family [Krasilnikoviella flava]